MQSNEWVSDNNASQYDTWHSLVLDDISKIAFQLFNLVFPFAVSINKSFATYWLLIKHQDISSFVKNVENIFQSIWPEVFNRKNQQKSLNGHLLTNPRNKNIFFACIGFI